ncbi:calmodulin-binding protein 60 E-like [Punica granatum]|uniref:Calmodulin-binding protein 60 E-like n=1 Tax=Punica granatum TaxID=22663 RepID=A0A6P8E6B7_PUNGR|nr:calmodulin-binding protein 60 E-like [Punica granatum]
MEMATEGMRRIYGGNPDKYQRLWLIFNSLKEKIVHPILAQGSLFRSTTKSQRCLQLQFVTRIPYLLVTGQEVKSEKGSPVHVFLVARITGNVVQDRLSTLNLTVSALEGDHDEESGNTWQREDFERNEITDVPLMTGNLQVTLKDGMGTLGDFCFNYSSDIARSGKFKLGVKTLTDECGGICICEGISNAFVVKDSNDARAPDATASQMHQSEDSQLESTMDELTQLVSCPTRWISVDGLNLDPFGVHWVASISRSTTSNRGSEQ